MLQSGREQRQRQRDRTPATTASCEFCSESFTQVRKSQRFCSERCSERRRVQDVRRHENGEPVMPGDLIPCERCEGLFVLPGGKGQRRYCSDECRRKARNHRLYPDREWACRDCSAPIERERSQRVERCEPCKAAESLRATRAWIRANPERALDLWRKGRHRRRALLNQAPYESISSLDIYERDGWTCGICIEPMDRDLRYPDPMSPSLDHIVPLSKGGHHVRDNVQASHLLCNVIKNDTMEMV